ncbi:MAG: hypothetical protein NC094_11985 [Bacteroidales bacterium]|nr:hypothetical protein [Lachnoclostridium sp.]MCM1385285.1 hypothetical protein [Lachnoclostridium sp.]MCM1466129.1 hypothetical protein [Bacteroidales bacterium]
MGRYEDYIARLCRTGRYTPEEAKEFATCKEVEKYYQEEGETADTENSTYTPLGECR